MGQDKLSLATPTVAVFSHPNHEMVALGIIATLNCPIVFLTDGGASKRAADTENALRAIGHRAPVFFLAYSDQDIYSALLARDGDFFALAADRIAGHLSELDVRSILTVPVELHNPLHDLAPMICRRAARESGVALFYETPLIFQDAGGAYRLNRFPAETPEVCEYTVPEAMAESKRKLYEENYGYLRSYLESLGCAPGAEVFRSERYRRAPAPGGEELRGRRPRYEERGFYLKSRGAVAEIITYEDHFSPTVARLLA
jgi:hypothetical protein